MSMEMNEQVECPECGKKSDFTIWKSLNIDLDPQMREKVMNGTLFEFECPHCNKKSNIVYPFLYHDMTHGLMCYFDSPDNLDEILESIENMKKDELASIAMKNEQIRVVFSYPELVEKIKIFEAGLNDRALELLKLLVSKNMAEQQPDFEIGNIFFETNDKNEPILFMFDKDGNPGFTYDIHPEEKLYDNLVNQAANEDDSPVVNRGWAEFVTKRAENRKKRGVFLLRWKPGESVYGPYEDDLKKLKNKPVSIIMETGDVRGIEEGDLAVIYLPEKAEGLTGIGRFEGEPFEVELKSGERRYVANIKLDFLINRMNDTAWEGWRFLSKYFPSVQKKGEWCEQLDDKDAAEFLTAFASYYIAYDKPNQMISFNKNEDFRQTLCMYINDFNHDFRSLLCGAWKVLGNASFLTYNSVKLEKHPKKCEDKEKFLQILIPDCIEPQSLDAVDFQDVEASDVTLKVDSRYEKQKDGSFTYKTERTDGIVHIESVIEPPEVVCYQKEDGSIGIENKVTFHLLPVNEDSMVKDFYETVKEKQGILESHIGTTKGKLPYAYIVTKEVKDMGGVTYYLNLQLHHWDTIINIEGSFEEIEMTGERDSWIFGMMHSLDLAGFDDQNNMTGWVDDRYKPKDGHKGIPMNKSEQELFDDAWPIHPLSVCRRFVRDMLENN